MTRTLRNGQRRAPLVPQDIQANTAIGIDVRVVDFGREGHLRGLEGVVRREGDRQEEYTARVRRVALNVSQEIHTGPMIVACHCVSVQPSHLPGTCCRQWDRHCSWTVGRDRGRPAPAQ